jgi:hypothetical protein
MNRESGSVIAVVSGDSVEIDQSAVRSVDAERVELRQAAAQHVRGETLEMSESAMMSVRGADIRMDDCAAAIVLGERVALRSWSSRGTSMETRRTSSRRPRPSPSGWARWLELRCGGGCAAGRTD